MHFPSRRVCAVLGLLVLGLSGPGLKEVAGKSRGHHGDSFAVRGARIYPVSASSEAPQAISSGVLLVEGGKIKAIGSDLEVPPGTRVLDLSGSVIVPGLVAGATGLAGAAGGMESVGAQYRAIDAYDPFSEHHRELSGGVTTVHLSPGRDRLVSGQGAVVKLGVRHDEAGVLAASSDVCVQLTESALRPPYLVEVPIPSSWDQVIRPAETQMPQSRIGRLLELDRWVELARAGEGLESGPRRASLRALSTLLAERQPFRFEARSASDIVLALSWLERTGSRGYLALGAESHAVLDRLVASGRSVILEVPGAFGTTGVDIGPRAPRVDSRDTTAARLFSRGISFALCGPKNSGAEDLLLYAGLAVAGGLSPSAALEAVTRTPAEILGVSHRVGSLEVGKDADFVVLTGEPFESTTSVREVYVDGRRVYRAHKLGTVVKAETLFLGDGTELRDGAVLIEEGKIVAVGRSVPHPPGARVIDGGAGSYLTPGFVDAHGHLGLEGDRSAPGTGVPLWRTVGAVREDSVRAARSGVTTVLLSPYRANGRGSQVAAIKTFGEGREQLVAKPLAAVKFSTRVLDPLNAASAIKSALKAGKSYYDQWVKYDAALKKWREEQEKKKAEAAKKKAAAVQEKKKEESKSENTVEETTQVSDPISGRWEATISGGPIPEPQKGNMVLKHEEGSVSGRLGTPFGDEAEVTGTFSGTKLVLELDVDTPMGPPTLEAELDREDHLLGTISIGPISLNFEANRTEREVGEIKITKKRKSKDKDGRPTAPTIKPELEPFRALFQGEIAALVEVGLVPEMKAVLEVFTKTYKLPVVLLGASEADRISEALKEAKVGVVLATELVGERRGIQFVPGDVLSRAGIAVGFQSGGEDRARSLRSRAIFAVRQGMDQTEALKALTSYPAQLFKLEDRVGSLAAGKDGDVLLFSGHPLETTSRLQAVIVGGTEVPRP